jgi:hypothetical protein
MVIGIHFIPIVYILVRVNVNKVLQIIGECGSRAFFCNKLIRFCFSANAFLLDIQ